MGKKEKGEVKLDDGLIASPGERKFKEKGINEKYELVRVEQDRAEAERIGKGVQKLFPEERTRVAPVEVKTKAYGLYFKESKEPKPKREPKPKKERKESKPKKEHKEPKKGR
jgi:hypothetical protein